MLRDVEANNLQQSWGVDREDVMMAVQIGQAFSRKFASGETPTVRNSVLSLPKLVDATQALNLSAGVSNCKVLRGRSLSSRGTLFRYACECRRLARPATYVAGSSSAAALRNGDHSDRADVRFARPDIQIYDAHVVDLYQWVCARYPLV